ncbi:PRP1 splicing factor, N-terminal-domain-containing protein [Paraphysoderma sedebokerense]|nr:PRP1 splicing factor, N-terminal-domain-containing protein [Paraphysoderma sedebokerense]
MEEGKKEEDDENINQDPDNETGLFNSLPYEADDEEADNIYAAVDAKMDERRKARREAREKEELERIRKERPKIQQEFADVRRQLATMTDDDWAAIPEAGNIAGRKRKKENPREWFTPVPDSVLQSAAGQNEFVNTLDAQEQKLGGIATPFPADGMETTNLAEIGAARDRVLGLKLDQLSDSVSGQTVVDPKGYLTDLNSVVLKSDAEIGDIKKARLLLKSVTTTNPKHAPGWIAAARLEEISGKMVQARQVIAKGCEECPKSEDVWLEAARLNTVENAKIILANAVRQLPRSTKIWLHASSIETETKAKKIVLRRALEFIPNSVKIWKAAISLETDPNDARILLSRAVECVPLSVELWLALAKLETYENSRKVLNRARGAIPTSHEIWIAAAKLEETQGNEKMVDMIISRAVTALSQKGTVLNRDQWMKEAMECEKVESILTCQAIVRNTLSLGVEEEDRKETWMEDAESAIANNAIKTARAIYAYALKVFPGKKSIWRRAAFLEKENGTRESLDEILAEAVKYCPKAEMLWLMAAKEKWLAGDIDSARRILHEAFIANPNSSQIFLAAVKLESENNEYTRARALLAKAREQAGDEPRVWMKSAVLERQLGELDDAIKILEVATSRFKDFEKFWMIWGQVEVEKGRPEVGREVYAKGLKNCPKSITLWILLARLEEETVSVIKARSTLERARLLNPKTAELWVESVRIELRHGNTVMARTLLSKGLQDCPTDGRLWTEAIFMENRPQRRSKMIDAVKKCGESDKFVLIAGARLFWFERRIDKARSWFNTALKIDPDWGDTWAYLYKLETSHGTEQQQQDVINKCVSAEPRHGEIWTSVSKNLKNVGKNTEAILKLVAEKVPAVV